MLNNRRYDLIYLKHKKLQYSSNERANHDAQKLCFSMHYIVNWKKSAQQNFSKFKE